VPNQKFDQKFPIATVDTQDSSLGHYNEISLINIYSADLKIKARVITKSQMRTYNNQKGQGHVFSVLLLDGSSAPENVIKGTFFNEQAIKFNELVFEGQIYVFSQGEVKPKNPKFNNTKHCCELLFNKTTTIESAAECVRIPENSFNFELISSIEKYPKWHELDILVIIKKIGQPEDINLKNGGKKCKREVTVFDESKKSIEIVMWGADTTINGFEH
jgi:replication factor A1